jgi:3-hydroxyisobutyrate dehydrogenase-like beta-hydroxyacid dehydrogenase
VVFLAALVATLLWTLPSFALDRELCVDNRTIRVVRLGFSTGNSVTAGFPVRLALKDLELVREVEQRSRATMPLLDAVLERFVTAGEDLADQDLAAIYELADPS